MFDTHVHCEFSIDSSMTLVKAKHAADLLGNVGFCVTEHWDYDYPGEPDKFTFDRDAYFNKYQGMRDEKKLLLGIEIGMQPQLAAKDDAVTFGYAFDYIIGSIHILNGQDLYYKKCYKGLSQQEAEEAYLKAAIACVENHDNFDTFAHIDYICRYWPYTGKEQELHLDEHKDLYTKLFKLLIEKGKMLEFNTRRLDDQAPIHTMLTLGKYYHELGGQYCTIGSDAHHTAHVGRRLQMAAIMAKECGLQPVYFKERQMFRDHLL